MYNEEFNDIWEELEGLKNYVGYLDHKIALMTGMLRAVVRDVSKMEGEKQNET